MTKKLISCLFIMATVAISATVWMKSKTTENLTELQLSNIEAISSNENNGGVVSADCPGGTVECARIWEAPTHTLHIFFKP